MGCRVFNLAVNVALFIGLSSSAVACTEVRFTAEQWAAYLRILDEPTPVEPTPAELGFPAWAIAPELDPVDAASQRLRSNLPWLPLFLPVSDPAGALPSSAAPPIGDPEIVAPEGYDVVFHCGGRVTFDRS